MLASAQHEHMMSNLWDDPLSVNKATDSPKTDTPQTTHAQTGAVDPAPAQAANLSVEPVKAEDKRVINGLTDVNQLAPFKYPWAWNFFLSANKNHWSPLDIKVNQDVADYNNVLSDAEKHVFKNVMSYLTTSGILAMRNIGLALMEKMTAPELQIYQARQIYEQGLHTSAYQQCVETIGLDQGDLYNRYRTIPEINQKIQISNRYLEPVMRPDLDLNDPEVLEQFTMAYLFFTAVFEGNWLYHGFTPIFAIQRQGRLKNVGEMMRYIMRDKSLHYGFGIRAINQILQENPVKLDPVKIQQMWQECEAAEATYIGLILQDPIEGYSVDQHMEQHRHIANERARALGMQAPFPGAQNVLTWLDDQIKINKDDHQSNDHVSEHQGGALSWD